LTAYSLRRLLASIPLLLGVATIVFFLLSLAPGDPSFLFIGRGMSPEMVETVRRNMGLDDPLLVRYLRWLLALARGDFGYSFSAQMPVLDRIMAALPNTLLLASVSLVLAFLAGIVLGVIQAVRQYSLLDAVLSGGALFFYSMPSFWLAIMLILVFSVNAANAWGWPLAFPASGVVSPGYDLLGPFDQLKNRVMHLVLPTLSLTLVLAAGVARYVRASMLEVIHQDYIRTARAKGLPESRVIFKHALRNGLIPVVTLFGLYLPLLLSGTVFIEYVFAWPGMGKLLVDSILQRDYPVVLAGTFLFGGMVVLGNLFADLVYGVVDPRIRYGGRHD
jgi:peptide/nickel transport system permease protein